MRDFTDDHGRPWTALAREEQTPRHHGRWFLVFREAEGNELPMPEVRWQTRASAERTIRTMGEFELRRRLQNVCGRFAANDGDPEVEAGPVARDRTNVSAG